MPHYLDLNPIELDVLNCDPNLRSKKTREAVMGKRQQSDPRSHFVVTMERDGTELSRRVVSAFDPPAAIEEAVEDLTRAHGVDLFDEAIDFRAEKI